MTNDELQRAAATLKELHVARRAYEAAHPVMPWPERLQAAWAALVECRYAMEGTLRGWRC